MPLIVARKVEATDYHQGNSAWWNWAKMELSSGRLQQGALYNCISALLDSDSVINYRLPAADADLFLSWAKRSPEWETDLDITPKPIVIYETSSLNHYLQPDVLINILNRGGSEIWFHIENDQWTQAIIDPGVCGIGGDPVPSGCLEETSIISTRMNDVIKWLETYELPHEDAQKIAACCPQTP